MSHTPEPWHVTQVQLEEINGKKSGVFAITNLEGQDMSYTTRILSFEEQLANASHIVACVNGCAGLNPAAYRECVDVLRDILDTGNLPTHGVLRLDYEPIQRALAHAASERKSQ